MTMLSEVISGEEYLHQDVEAPRSMSKRLVRSMSHKFRKKNKKCEEAEDDNSKRLSLNCLSLYNRGGGCKVGAYTGEEYGNPSNRRRSSANEDEKGIKIVCAADETGIACFSYGIMKEFLKKNNKKYLEHADPVCKGGIHVFLPDDILEMCFLRLPVTSLMNARLVCKKWRYLTTTPRFLQIRNEGKYQTPWLFLFGTEKYGCFSREIQAVDVSQNQWHKIDANILKGRFMFSVTGIHDEIYIVGGCSSLASFSIVDRPPFKTHKGVFIFSPLTKSWRKVASMKYARSRPILGVSEVNSSRPFFQNPQNRQDRRFSRSRNDGVLDVYEDPHRLSVRRQNKSNSDDYESTFPTYKKSNKFIKQKHDHQSNGCCKRFIIIAVGGLGSFDDQLDSAEIYDPMSNKWTEIQKLPIDFGTVSAGVFCNEIFYVYSESDKLIAYDMYLGYWIHIETSSFPARVCAYHPKLVSCHGRLFMLSVSWCESDGEIGQRNKAVRKLWELDVVYLSWSEVSVHPDAPMDWDAGFVADKELIAGIEMFKIFGQVLGFLTVCDVSNSEINWRHIPRNNDILGFEAASRMSRKSIVLLHL